MTDRELLEMAAKAAGLWIGFSETTPELGRPYVWNDDHKTSRWWNPLADDGDALRLAVKLGLVVDCSRPSAGRPFSRAMWIDETCDNGTLTRRAIVLAAAEIGKAMP